MKWPLFIANVVTKLFIEEIKVSVAAKFSRTLSEGEIITKCS